MVHSVLDLLSKAQRARHLRVLQGGVVKVYNEGLCAPERKCPLGLPPRVPRRRQTRLSDRPRHTDRKAPSFSGRSTPSG